MAYQNPYMDALQKGASVANQGMQGASNTVNSTANIFGSVGSLSMKMLALLDQEDARKQQQLLQSQQVLGDAYNNAINDQLKQQQLGQQKDYQQGMLDLGKQKIDIANKQLDMMKSTKEANLLNTKLKLNQLDEKKRSDYITAKNNIYKNLAIINPITGEKTLSPEGQQAIAQLDTTYGISMNTNTNQPNSNDRSLIKNQTPNTIGVGKDLYNIGQTGTFGNALNNTEPTTTTNTTNNSIWRNYRDSIFNRNISNTEARKTMATFGVKTPQELNNRIDTLSPLETFGITPQTFTKYRSNPSLLNSIFLDKNGKLDPNKLVLFDSISPDQFKSLVKYYPNIAGSLTKNLYTLTQTQLSKYKNSGDINGINRLNQEVMNHIGSQAYRQYGFDKLFTNVKNNTNTLITGENTLYNKNIDNSINSLIGLNKIEPGGGFEVKTIEQSANENGIPMIANLIVDLNNNKNTFMHSVVGQWFDNSWKQKVFDKSYDTHWFSAANIEPYKSKQLQDTTKQLNNLSLQMKGSFLRKNTLIGPLGRMSKIGHQKYPKVIGGSNIESNDKLYSKYKIVYKKFYNQLKSAKLLKTMNNVEGTVKQRYLYYTHLGNNPTDAFHSAWNDAVNQYGIDKTSQAIKTGTLLIRYRTILNYYGRK